MDQLGEIVEYFFATREKISTGQHETRIPISSHKALRSQANVHFVRVQINDIVKLANGRHQSSTSCVSSWYQDHSSCQQSKLVFLGANVTTHLHVGQDRSMDTTRFPGSENTSAT